MDSLIKAVQTIGKSQWRDMLLYVAELHEKCTHPPRPPFPFPWEEIGTGYCYGPAFGHWDIAHAILDVMAFEPEHAKNQILNNLAAQQEDGLVPGVIWMRKKKPDWSRTVGHPPVWPVAVQDYTEQTGSDELISHCYEPLIRQIGWFESNRKATPVGFYYTDILNHKWESGVDEGIRFHKVRTGPFACVDATSHVYVLYDCAAQWSERVGKPSGEYKEKAHELQEFIQNKLFDDETGFFHDVWSVGDPSKRCMALEGMWPIVVGGATWEQADRVMDENLLNHKRFFPEHPVSTVGVEDPLFELRMWRGPTWNSMTYWAARGCMRYSRPHAARRILEEALDASARQFQRTGTIWEFYHPHGGEPEELQRKPHTRQNQPCRDYLGHNPLIAMALMYEDAIEGEKEAEDTPTYTVKQAKDVIRSRFPDFTIDKMYFAGEGSDFCAYAVNDEYIFRFGANRESEERLHWEQYLLPKLQARLDIALPKFEIICPMDNGRPLVVYRMIKGKSFREEISRGLSDASKLRVAKQLADFLTVLHTFPVEKALAWGVNERSGQERCREFREGAHEIVYPNLSEQERDTCEWWFQEYLRNPDYSSYKPALVHGDLQGHHVLFDPDTESIAGVIDFSDIWIGDPDHDLYYLLEEHGEDFLGKLLRYYPHDDPEGLFWKSRFFYLLRCLDEIIWGMEDNHQEHVEEGWRDLREFLGDPPME
jgi:putative isomerase